MKLLIMQFSATSCRFISLRCNCSPQRPVALLQYFIHVISAIQGIHTLPRRTKYRRYTLYNRFTPQQGSAHNPRTRGIPEPWSIILLATCFTLVSCFSCFSTLKMEARCSSENSLDFQRTICRYIPEDVTLLNSPWF
jgi:hypothetical protein